MDDSSVRSIEGNRDEQVVAVVLEHVDGTPLFEASAVFQGISSHSTVADIVQWKVGWTFRSHGSWDNAVR